MPRPLSRYRPYKTYAKYDVDVCDPYQDGRTPPGVSLPYDYRSCIRLCKYDRIQKRTNNEQHSVYGRHRPYSSSAKYNSTKLHTTNSSSPAGDYSYKQYFRPMKWNVCDGNPFFPPYPQYNHLKTWNHKIFNTDVVRERDKLSGKNHKKNKAAFRVRRKAAWLDLSRPSVLAKNRCTLYLYGGKVRL